MFDNLKLVNQNGVEYNQNDCDWLANVSAEDLTSMLTSEDVIAMRKQACDAGHKSARLLKERLKLTFQD